MLKNIKITNFYSIGEEQEISFEINQKDVLDDSARKVGNDTFLNLVSCIIGPNASGKTNALKAISFLFWFINESYTSLKNETNIPISQHMLKKNQPVKMEIEFYDSDVLYKYLIELNQGVVIHEKLEKKSGRMTNVFESARIDGKFSLKENRLKINEADEARFKERRNVPLLSCLIDTGYLPEISFFKNFKSNVTQSGTSFGSLPTKLLDLSAEIQKNEYLRQEILNFSKDVDLSISDFRFKDYYLRNHTLKEVKTSPLLECIHNTKDKQFILPIFEESNGTQHSIYLLFEILPMLNSGGVIVIDEIESGIHPFVVQKIISLFENKKTNPKNTQLFFSTHQHLLLNDRTKTQIFIAEKIEGTSETEIYHLDDIEGIRNDENFLNKYLAGAYGGIPKIKWL